MDSKSREPTPAEKAIKELRERVQDVVSQDWKYNDDLYVLQWLRAKKMNIDRAENAIRRALAWRNEHGLEDLTESDFPPEFPIEYHWNFDGVSRDGKPVVSWRSGIIDFKSLISKFGLDKVLLYTAFVCRRFEKLMIEANRRNYEKSGAGPITEDSASGIVIVSDSGDYTFWQLQSYQCIQFYTKSVQISKNYFPALISQTICLNCNRFSYALWKIAKPLLVDQTVQIHVFDTNQKQWLPFVHQHIHPDQLRTPYGGNMIS